VELTNTGPREGSEVVQLYIRDRVSSVTRPVKELKGFRRVRLGPGESTTVALEITPESLAFHDLDMDFVVEPGEFEVQVGTSSRDTDLRTVILRVD
jgi:beta-glucosidase